MKKNAYAKLNILLNVRGKYFNNYHSVESVMMPINLHDTLDIEVLTNSPDIVIECPDEYIPRNEKNILYKCAKLFQSEFKISDGVKIILKKNIPVQSGLGGESSDAACLMHFYNDMYKLHLSYNSVFYLGRLLSWDVPVCYFQKCIYINDQTNVCEVLNTKSTLFFLLVKPSFGVSTKEAFDKLDCINHENANPYPLIKALQQYPKEIGKHLHNCFIQTDIRLIEEYNLGVQLAKQAGFDGFSMSGTGSCFFGITTDEEILTKGYYLFNNRYPFVRATSTILS